MRLNRKIKSLIFATCCAVGLVALGGFVSSRQKAKTCKKVTVKIDNEFNNYFISDLEVRNILTRDGARKLEGTDADAIDLKNLEMRVRSHKFVKNAQVYRDLEGNINVSIKQNRPIARILHTDTDAYIDGEGNVLPLSDRFTARVLPVTKSVLAPAFNKEFFQDSVGRAYLQLIEFIEQDNFWKAQIAQMHIDAKGKVIFLPQVGNQNIEFGKPEDIDDKFRKLMVFYQKVLPVMGWDRYKRVNVEFHNQIICE
jgi:cell division protein FtsQ